MATAAERKVNATKDYRLFTRTGDNRDLDVKKHKRLLKSMKEYGFLPCFPIVCVRTKSGKLNVKDGQHRLAIAEMLGIQVFWVETTEDFDVATINSTSIIWKLRDYCKRFADDGIKSYQEALEFSDLHSVPIGLAISILGGTVSFTNVSIAFYDGKFEVVDRELADKFASIYVPFVSLNRVLRNARFIEACIAVCRVKNFDVNRLVSNAGRCREKLVQFASRDAYLEMLEAIYNFKRSNLVGLRAEATMAMRARNPANGKMKQESCGAVSP